MAARDRRERGGSYEKTEMTSRASSPFSFVMLSPSKTTVACEALPTFDVYKYGNVSIISPFFFHLCALFSSDARILIQRRVVSDSEITNDAVRFCSVTDSLVVSGFES